MKRVLSNKDESYIRRNYLKKSHAEMGEKIGVSKGTITSACKRLGLRVPESIKAQRRVEGIRKRYSEVVHPEDETIKVRYLDTNIKTLARLVKRSHTFVRGRLKALNLVIPDELTEQRKRTVN